MTSDKEPATVSSPEIQLNQEDRVPTVTPVKRIPHPLLWSKRDHQLTVDNPIAGSPLSPRVWTPASSYAMASARSNSSKNNDPVYRNPKDMTSAVPTSSSSSTELVVATTPASTLVPDVIPETVLHSSQVNQTLEELCRSGSLKSLMAKSREETDRSFDRLLHLEKEIQLIEKDLPKLKTHVSKIFDDMAKYVAEKTKGAEKITQYIRETETKSQPLRKERNELISQLSRSRPAAPAMSPAMATASNGAASIDPNIQQPTSTSSTLAPAAVASSSRTPTAAPSNGPSTIANRHTSAVTNSKKTPVAGKRPLNKSAQPTGSKVKRLCRPDPTSTAPKTTSGVRGAQPIRPTLKKKTATLAITSAPAAPAVRVKQEKPDSDTAVPTAAVTTPETVVGTEAAVPSEEFVIDMLNVADDNSDAGSDVSDSDIFKAYTGAGDPVDCGDSRDPDVLTMDMVTTAEASKREQLLEEQRRQQKEEEEEARRRELHYVPPDQKPDENMGIVELNPDPVPDELDDEMVDGAQDAGNASAGHGVNECALNVESCGSSDANAGIPSPTGVRAAAKATRPEAITGSGDEHPLAHIQIKKEKE